MVTSWYHQPQTNVSVSKFQNKFIIISNLIIKLSLVIISFSSLSFFSFSWSQFNRLPFFYSQQYPLFKPTIPTLISLASHTYTVDIYTYHTFFYINFLYSRYITLKPPHKSSSLCTASSTIIILPLFTLHLADYTHFGIPSTVCVSDFRGGEEKVGVGGLSQCV